jgi:hypothetical protein
MSILMFLNNSDKLTINNVNHKEKLFFKLRQNVNYYLSILDNDTNTIISNVSPSYTAMYYHGKTIAINTQTGKDIEIISKMNTISHNFTLIQNINSKEVWGVGGCGKRAPKNYTEGIYLLYSKNNMKSWKLYGNIINAKKTKGWNPNGDSTFDSNITCFKSDILKKYVIITRYNIGCGSRGFQVFKSDHFKRGWDNGTLCNINTYVRKHNYYMNKIIEIPKYQIFFMVAPFSGRCSVTKLNNAGLKILISKDLINWIDCGFIKEAKAVKSHSSTPAIQPVGIKFDEKTDTLTIFYHDNYFSKSPSTIYIIERDINNLIKVSYKTKNIISNVIIKTHEIMFNLDPLNKKQECKISVNIDNKNYIMSDKNTITLDKSIVLEKEYKLDITIINANISGFKFI